MSIFRQRYVEDQRGAEASRRFGFGGVENHTLSEQITRAIVRSVLRGELASGAKLPSEHELARQFDVSRAVIREAVQAVAMLGLVQRRQGRGTRVAPRHEWRHLAPELLLARTEIGGVDGVLLELLELRRMVEVEAAGLAASRITDEGLLQLRVHLEAMDRLADDPVAFTRHDVEFHGVILQAVCNQLLPPLFDQLRPLLEFARIVSATARPGMLVRSQRGHHLIRDAIEAGDADEAKRAMSDHLSWTANLDYAERERRLLVRRPAGADRGGAAR